MKIKYLNKEIEIADGATIEFTNGELVIKNKKEQFNRGDVLISCNGRYPFIFNGFNEEGYHKYVCGLGACGKLVLHSGMRRKMLDLTPIRKATKEEAKVLLDALKKAGKHWNSKTLELEYCLKAGDVCIFWHDDKKMPVLGRLNGLDDSDKRLPFQSHTHEWYPHAIKCESIEQYLNFIKTIKNGWNFFFV